VYVYARVSLHTHTRMYPYPPYIAHTQAHTLETSDPIRLVENWEHTFLGFPLFSIRPVKLWFK